MTTVADLVAAVDRVAPFALAEAWDHVGLLLGDEDWPVERVLVALDASDAVVEEAERLGAGALLTHHPLLFKGAERLTGETRYGRLSLRLAEGRRALVAAHTNLDSAEGGLCDRLAEAIGLSHLEPLRAEAGPKRCKLVVFTPEADLATVQSAAFDAGAGRIGRYTECSWRTAGTGTFLPGEDATPTVGERGTRNEADEWRLEMVVPKAALGRVVAAVVRAHSYEEPAVDVYPLEPSPAPAGLGRIGRLKHAVTAAALAERMKAAVRAASVGLGGDPEASVERVAVVSGSGSGMVGSVLASGVDTFVTGELKMHEVQDLAAAGVAVVLGGHYETERVPMEAWAPDLASALDVPVTMSESETGVVRTV